MIKPSFMWEEEAKVVSSLAQATPTHSVRRVGGGRATQTSNGEPRGAHVRPATVVDRGGGGDHVRVCMTPPLSSSLFVL